MILAGVDEAGLGPVLGPLATASAAFRAPDGTDPDAAAGALFAAFAPALADDPRAARRDPAVLAVADSKRAHAAGGPALLERTAGAFLALAGQARSDRAGLLAALGTADAAAHLAAAPWHADPPPYDLPYIGPAADALAAAARRAADAGWGFARFDARVAAPAALNADFAAGRNKHEASMERTGALLARLDAAFPGEAMAVTVDLQGGRRRYAAFLGATFPDAWVWTESETAAGSGYRVERRGRPARRIVFRAKADATSPPAALASMLAKALRERLMGELNAWFGGRVPGLARTAGYPGDAPRWLAATAACRAAGGWPDDLLIRRR